MRTGFLLSLPILASALPFQREISQPARRKAITVPVKQWKRPGANHGLPRRQDANGPSVGLGDIGDLIYAVDVNVGGTDVTVHMDTGSSDLWIISDACTTGSCPTAKGKSLPASTGKATGAQVTLNFGDSLTGTTATGPVNLADTTIAGITLPQNPFAAVDFTNSTIVGSGVPTSGILGLSFPTASHIMLETAVKELGSKFTIDSFIDSTASVGPLLSRMAISGQIDQPMFTITLQRDTVDVGGNQGALTLGDLPEGVDNSTLTWVPVRLYSPAQGGSPATASNPNEIFPLRWEVVIDNVFFDGKQLPTPAGAIDGKISALIDTGNSLLRGPQDVVTDVYNAITPGSGATAPSYACSDAHTLEFEIGGQRFPVDPRDFVGTNTGDATTCEASRLVVTDPPSATGGQLFSWSLGDPFMKSNLVAFYFGNLTHPSLDPPRIGFKSTVPKNATQLLQQAVNDAQANGGAFESTINAAGTGTIAVTQTAAAPSPTSNGGDSASPTSTDAATPTGTDSAAATSTDSSSATSPTAASPSSSSSPSPSSSSSGGVVVPTSSTSGAVAGTSSSSSPTAVVPTNTVSPTASVPNAGDGASTITNVVVTTASSSSSTDAAPSSSASASGSASGNGALSGARAPVTWAVALGALAVAMLSI